MPSPTVPVQASLADIYPSTALATEAPRWNQLLSTFAETYDHPATFVARSPGRVNIIGEHIDYSLYSVLPMAITPDALLAVRAVEHSPAGHGSFTVKLANLKGDKYTSKTFDVGVDGVEIDATKFEWTNYFKAGLRGALDLLRRKRGEGFAPVSMEVVVDGSVPIGGGLSSSAAFVSASALAVMVANGEKEVDRKELTELAIVSERAVGVNSGGMDQAASVLSEKDAALFVTFTPRLDAKPIQFPPTSPELCFVIAQSFVTSNKQVTGPVHYNLRVVEVTMAAAFLHVVLNPPGTQLPEDAGPLGTSLQGFHELFFYHHGAEGDKAARSLSKEEELQKLIELTKQTLPQEQGYTREEIAKVLGIDVEEVEKRFMSSFPVRAERFKLRQRALHVFEEALRVVRFLTLLERPVHTGASDTTAFNMALGDLMNQTQDSCRDLYECSCEEIDRICSIARAAGAYGSRLTGAGWGGCSVHLVPADKVADVEAALEREYYAGRELSAEERAGAVTVSRPGSGSAIYMVEEAAK